MSFGFSIGDFIAVGQLLSRVCQDCSKASQEFHELSQVINTAKCCVESARIALQDIYLALPRIHQTTITYTLVGLRSVASDISDELREYNKISSSTGGARRAKLKFALLENPREAESRITLRISMLNTCMAIIICDSVTKSRLQPYEPDQLVVHSDNTANAIGTLQSPPSANYYLAERPVHKWIVASQHAKQKETFWSLSKPAIAARGFFDYCATAQPVPGTPRINHVDYELSIVDNVVVGTSRDTGGTANIRGVIDPSGRRISFQKTYVKGQCKGLVWEYKGSFTACGIAGEWCYAGDPPKIAYHRGSFGIWLREDEDASGQTMDAQLKMLTGEGKILSRSLTFE